MRPAAARKVSPWRQTPPAHQSRILAEWPDSWRCWPGRFGMSLVVGDHLFSGMAVMGLSLLAAAGCGCSSPPGRRTLAIAAAGRRRRHLRLLGVALIASDLVQGVFSGRARPDSPNVRPLASAGTPHVS